MLRLVERSWRASGVALLVGLLAGCSGIRTYPNGLDKNLLVHTSTDSASIFSRVRASLSISRVDAQCRIQYEGTVDLDKSPVSVGIPADRWSYLVFDFASSGLFVNSSTTAQATLLKPLAGYRYDVEVTYRDDLYNVIIREAHAGTDHKQDVTLRQLDTCQPRLNARRD
jgi:hypothetical protein